MTPPLSRGNVPEGIVSRDLRWSELSRVDLYRILQLRAEVFGVEQNCVYQDLDDLDQRSWHLLVEEPASDNAESSPSLVGYVRVISPDPNAPLLADHATLPSELVVGRLVVKKTHRHLGLGRTLMFRAIAACRTHFPEEAICIDAQRYLESFYKTLGFETISDMFILDGIEHVKMMRPKDAR